MGQLFQRFIGQPLANVAGRSPWVVPADIEETDDGFLVDIDLPNVRRDDVQLELRENTLRVFGETKERERVGTVRRQMRRVGEFEYLVTLPGDIDPERVDATLHDGVLTVWVGKAVASQPRRVEIKSP
jgi:HSP20 family protein